MNMHSRDCVMAVETLDVWESLSPRTGRALVTIRVGDEGWKRDELRSYVADVLLVALARGIGTVTDPGAGTITKREVGYLLSVLGASGPTVDAHAAPIAELLREKNKTVVAARSARSASKRAMDAASADLHKERTAE